MATYQLLSKTYILRFNAYIKAGRDLWVSGHASFIAVVESTDLGHTHD